MQKLFEIGILSSSILQLTLLRFHKVSIMFKDVKLEKDGIQFEDSLFWLQKVRAKLLQ